jgi:hypothetical protein
LRHLSHVTSGSQALAQARAGISSLPKVPGEGRQRD